MKTYTAQVLRHKKDEELEGKMTQYNNKKVAHLKMEPIYIKEEFSDNYEEPVSVKQENAYIWLEFTEIYCSFTNSRLLYNTAFCCKG